MAKPFHIQAETGSTSPAKRCQFVKPGFIDARNSKQFSKSETPPKTRIAKVGLRPLEQAQGLPASWYDNTLLLETNVHPSSSVEPDNVLIDPGKTIIVPSTEESLNPQATRKAASPPYARSRSNLATVTQQYVILLRVLLAEYRTTWLFHVLGGFLIPIGFAFFIAALGGAGNPEKAIYLLGGNMALSITTGPTSFLITKIGSARQSKEFNYWTALPIAKLLLVLAIVSIALVFALPGLLGIYVFGSLLLGLPFGDSSWLLVPLTPLGVLSLAGLGALLGLFAKNGEIANVFSNLLAVFIGVLSPVLLPPESLPIPLRIISQFMPTTYVADAFRAVLGGYPGINLALDIIILTLFAAVLLTITYFRLDWRGS